ncbi:T9SS type A sorting domain-containing protein [bacterium]|nr:T9SS type A sorting domain-containing protein [bacterium]
MIAFILFLMATSAVAQPVHGPYVVATADDEIKEFEVCVRGDTVDVLSLLRFSSYYFGYSLRDTEPLSSFAVLIPGDYPVRQLLDMTAASPERWVCLLHRNTREDGSTYGSFYFTTDLLFGHSSESEMINVETSSYVDSPNYHQGSWTEGHALQLNEGRIDVSYYIADIGPFDVWYTAGAHEYDAELNEVNSTSMIDYLGGPYVERGNRVIATGLPGDSLLAWSAWPPSGVRMFLGPWTEVEGYNCSFTATCEYLNLQESFLTDAGRIIGAFDDATLRQFIPGEDNTAECVAFAASGLDNVSAWAFHPSFGFAALQANPGSVLLARIDTAGNAVHPIGMLYGADGPPFVVDADLAITDDGKVVAVWSEYDEWGEGPRVLQLAWVDWMTYLAAPEHSIPTIPREHTISVHPNPFNSTVTIRYELPQAGPVTLKVYDLHGRLVETLIDDFTSAGKNEIQWSPEVFSSGVFFLSLDAPRVHTIRKLLYLK